LFSALLASGCGFEQEDGQDGSKSKVKEAVKDGITREFKIYESAKESLQESEAKSKSTLEAIDKELK
jgi:hypothetical protein